MTVPLGGLRAERVQRLGFGVPFWGLGFKNAKIQGLGRRSLLWGGGGGGGARIFMPQTLNPIPASYKVLLVGHASPVKDFCGKTFDAQIFHVQLGLRQQTDSGGPVVFRV